MSKKSKGFESRIVLKGSWIFSSLSPVYLPKWLCRFLSLEIPDKPCLVRKRPNTAKPKTVSCRIRSDVDNPVCGSQKFIPSPKNLSTCSWTWKGSSAHFALQKSCMDISRGCGSAFHLQFILSKNPNFSQNSLLYGQGMHFV